MQWIDSISAQNTSVGASGMDLVAVLVCDKKEMQTSITLGPFYLTS